MKLNNDEIYSIDTGKFTGRSPKDKWIVKNLNSDSDKNIWWGDVNQPLPSDIFDTLYLKAKNHFNSLENYYVYDGYCGSNPKSQKKVRFVHELSWQQHFVTNMFIRPETREEIQKFKPLSYQNSKIKFGLGDDQIEDFIKSIDDMALYFKYYTTNLPHKI